MKWLIFTELARNAVLIANTQTDMKIVPRLVDNPASPHVGLWAAPVRVREGDYADFWAAHLGALSVVSAAPVDLFEPPEEEPFE